MRVHSAGERRDGAGRRLGGRDPIRFRQVAHSISTPRARPSLPSRPRPPLQLLLRRAARCIREVKNRNCEAALGTAAECTHGGRQGLRVAMTKLRLEGSTGEGLRRSGRYCVV